MSVLIIKRGDIFFKVLRATAINNLSTATRIKDNKSFGSYIRAVFHINCYYNFNLCGIFKKMKRESFSQILNQDLEQGGLKFTEIKVQKLLVLMFVNRLKFSKISRKDLLGTKMCEFRMISPKKQIKAEKQTRPYRCCLPNYQTKQIFLTF